MPINHKLYCFLIERGMQEGLGINEQCEFVINRITNLEKKIVNMENIDNETKENLAGKNKCL